ncbi:hypothetical protein JMA_13380 [Jeotgalibacillus malaysiensis]|uniref:DUF3267 domain-containing protein n=1 Tax=Jeotgalibacillus malaysiensis TaxID=1508404 RepID=A0A0B5AJX8_9BACL|nr:DUF3267 domain-containing protein [Jeotgalibacillus malaysiensis]AJD90655.1 hypothetical protein JMA_13380 [Jeotgalibacillus malaysiensis]
MLHCWKSINVKKQYGFYRIFFLSAILVLTVFSFLHVSIQLISDQPMYDQYFLWFAIGFFLIYPLHKVFHTLPLAGFISLIQLKTRFHFFCVPIMSVRVNKPIPKVFFIMALVSPFLIINGVLLYASTLFPGYAHYFTILTAYHTGICLVDFLYARSLFRSPKGAFIEEDDDGYEILVPVKETQYPGI